MVQHDAGCDRGHDPQGTLTSFDANFRVAAIAAHAAWRDRLTNAIADRGDGLELAVVAADDRCELGLMLQRLGDGGGQALAELRAEHSRFHQHAARIVQMAKDGRVAAAQRALQGEYEAISSELVHLLQNWAPGS